MPKRASSKQKDTKSKWPSGLIKKVASVCAWLAAAWAPIQGSYEFLSRRHLVKLELLPLLAILCEKAGFFSGILILVFLVVLFVVGLVAELFPDPLMRLTKTKAIVMICVLAGAILTAATFIFIRNFRTEAYLSLEYRFMRLGFTMAYPSAKIAPLAEATRGTQTLFVVIGAVVLGCVYGVVFHQFWKAQKADRA